MAHADMSQKEFAFKLGVSEAEITRWFHGERAIPLHQLDLILNTLGLMIVSKTKLRNLLDKLFTDKDFLV